MKNKTKLYISLISLFLLIVAIKTTIVLFVNGPFIFSDEPCVIQKAIYLAKNFELKTCSDILQLEVGNPHPLYSIIISPIYLFLKGTQAYKAILVLNSILISSLVFPLYSIFKKFLKNNKLIFLNIFLILSLPQVVIFEKMLLTEILFIVICIWFLHFYLNSFTSKNKKLNKIIAVIFSILASLTRPFGFMIPIALVINEFFVNKKDTKKIALIYIPITAAAIALTLFFLLPGVIEILKTNVVNLGKSENALNLLKALKNQINSLTLTTFLVPTIIFFTYINKKDSPALKNIKYFLISLITLNLLISTQHFYTYLSTTEIDPGLITRYINISIIFIFIFALIFIQKYKNFKLNKTNTTISAILLISLLFINYKAVKHSLNLDLSIYYDTLISTKDNLIFIKKYSIAIILGISALLIPLTLTNKRKTLIVALSAIILTQSAFSYNWISQFTSFTPQTVEHLRDKESEIMFLGNPTNTSPLSLNYWRLLVLSNNHLSIYIASGITAADQEATLPEELINQLKSKYDYIISDLKLNLPLELETPEYGTGTSKNEYIYAL